MHVPPQHSPSLTQTSPFCVQNDGEKLHVFVPSESGSSQSSEHHSACVEHVLPAVLHDGLSGAHWPLLHAPEQHSPSLSHA
jgi:hypothetical protein